MTVVTHARILVLDDDPVTCRFMSELLTKPERDVETTTDPEQALARCRSQAIRPGHHGSEAQRSSGRHRCPSRCARKRSIDAGHHRHRLRRAREGRRSRARGRVRLRQQAFQHHRAQGAGRARASQIPHRGANDRRPRHDAAGAARPLAGDDDGLQANRARRVGGRAGADHRRERHREGTRGARHPSAWQPHGPAIRADQLRRAHRNAARIGALRPRQGLVHRRGQR